MVRKKKQLEMKSLLFKTSKHVLACDMIFLKEALMENFCEISHFRLNLCYVYTCAVGCKKKKTILVQTRPSDCW